MMATSHAYDDDNDIEIIVEVLDCLNKENIAQHIENIHEICNLTYDWSKTRTRAALNAASEKGFVLEVSFKGITTFQSAPTLKDPLTQKLRPKTERVQPHKEKSNAEKVLYVIRVLNKKGEETNLLNIFKALTVLHKWDDEKINNALSEASEKGLLMKITCKGETFYRIPPLAESPTKHKNQESCGREKKDDKTDAQVVLEVIEELRREKQGQYFDNIYSNCSDSYSWTEVRTKAALNAASRRGLVVEIAFKGKTSYRIPSLSCVVTSKDNSETKKVHNSKSDPEVVVDVIKFLDKSNKCHSFENIFNVSSETYEWSEVRTRTALNIASKKGFIIVITFKGISSYQIAPLSKIIYSVKDKKKGHRSSKGNSSKGVKDNDIEKWLSNEDNLHFYEEVTNVKDAVQDEMKRLSDEMKKNSLKYGTIALDEVRRDIERRNSISRKLKI